MRSIRVASTLLILLVLVRVPGSLSAQQTIEGRVLSALDGAPLQDVSVRVVGEDMLVGTDSAGRFRFELPEDREGVGLQIQVIGFAPIARTWMLPLERPLVIGLEQEAIALEGLEARVRVPVVERMDARLKANARLVSRTADQVALRSFEHQEWEVWEFLPEMNVVRGFGAALDCNDCLIMNGPFRARFFVDEFQVPIEQFRMTPVGEFCRIDVVRQPPKPRPNFQLVEAVGGVHAYTCDFMQAVARGERSLSPMLWPWDSLMGCPEELGRPTDVGPVGGGARC